MMAFNPSPEVKSILIRTPDLMTALSNEPLGVAGILLSKGFISGEIMSKLLVVSYTAKEKATILIEAVRNRIDISPAKFTEFLEILSQQTCAKEVAESLRSTYQSQLNQVDDNTCDESADIASKIETLENKFDSLRTQIIDELAAKPGITVEKLLDTVTSLPLSLKREYESSITERIQYMGSETQINRLFIHLNPLLSFMDYSLIEFFIKKFGSYGLKKDMQSFCSEMKVFMKGTTIQQLIDHFPGQPEIPPKFSLIEAKIGEDASKCTLEQLNTIRRKYCSEIKLSEIVFHLVAVVDSNSFIIKWIVPQVLAADVKEYTRNIKNRFFQKNKIASISLDKMWLYVSETELEVLWLQDLYLSSTDPFRTIYEQILCELKLKRTSMHDLSRYLMYQLPNFPENVSICLSKAFLNHCFPPSFMDSEMLEMLKIIVQHFGSDSLKTMMKSICSYMPVFTQHSTAQQLTNLQVVNEEHPCTFIEAECKIEKNPLDCTLDDIKTLKNSICANINVTNFAFAMKQIRNLGNGSFSVSWLVPSDLINDIMKFARNIEHIFYQKLKVTSLTLDGMWLYVSEAEIDAVWFHKCDTELNDQFLTMHKQMVYELETGEISEHPLSLQLMDQQPKLQSDVSIQLSEAFLGQSFPLSFVDFRILTIIIERFGSNCLKSVMKSYCKFMLIYTKQSTAHRLIELSPIQSDLSKYFVAVECRIMKEPLEYRLEKLLRFQARFCTIVNFDEVCFVMGKMDNNLSGSFTVSWIVPSGLATDLLKSVNAIQETDLFQEFDIAALKLGSEWLYNHQLSPFGAKLKKQYQQSQGSPSPVKWIPSPTVKIFRLAMIQRERVQQGHIEDRFVRMTVSGRVDDILHAKFPVELEHIFGNTSHESKIILIEGAPGSGKSTLAVHICQRWGKGELFQQFTVVILVQLRDPAVQKAQTIADLLPVENATVAQELATELVATDGRGVLWVLDGWDELPPNLQRDSTFRKLLPPESRDCNVKLLHKCSVIVTSRPISSGDLHPVVSSRIEVLGFTPEEQRLYFTECLEGDTKALEALIEKIQENPVIQSSCYLPLNAAFIVNTFKYRDQSLPNTEYEIYLSVILSCIQRHFEREGRGHDVPRELASLDDLSRSEAVREPFQCLCELGYRGVMDNKVTFSSDDLSQTFNTLSLLQAIESFLQSGKSVFYNFLHLSIQEVLSAYYIATWLSDSEQVSQFQQLFSQPRFAAVFQFYAAITKLKIPGIRQVIARIVEAKSKPLLVSLLRCLHETQDPSLCLYVAEKLEFVLVLSRTSLSPLDCLSVSFFLSSIIGKDIRVHLGQCYVSDLCAKCLSKYIDHVSRVTIDVINNEIREEGASYIASMLYFVEHLYLTRNPIGDIGAFLVSEAVRETTTLKTLILSQCGITSRGAEDLSRALAQNGSLEKLDISSNNLGDKGIGHMAEALKQNKQLKELWIGHCGMTDKGAAFLASALSINNSLKMLHMVTDTRALTEDGLSTITQSLANKSMFEKLAIPYEFDSIVCHLNQKINGTRKKSELQPITIEATIVVSQPGPAHY